MNEYDLVYMAGFFDGEGCVSIGYRKSRNYLQYQMKTITSQAKEEGKQICEWLKINFKGVVSSKKKLKEYHSSRYEWVLMSKQAYNFLKQIYPYLKIKKKQVKLAIEFQEILSNYRGKNYFSDIERIEKCSYFETVKQEMHFFNSSKS